MQKSKKKLVPPVTPGIFVGILLLFLIAFSRLTDGHPLMDPSMENDGTESPDIGDDLGNDDVDYNRREALENLQKIFGIRGQSANKSIRRKIPPQFMTELYNTIADSSGVTRARNPYNARIVRSYVERATWLSQLYLFDVSGLEINESIIEAELHLFRKRSDYKVINPAILRSPFYLIRVYQVLEGQSMNEPDVHRLLNVHYVGAHASGWQVFNVKQAVLAWISGAPNLGLLVTASTLFGDEATVEFTRRSEYNPSKQPILVLFNNDGRVDDGTGDAIPGVPRYYSYSDDEEEEDKDDPGAGENDTNDRVDVGKVENEEIDDYGSTVGRQKRQQDQSAFEDWRENPEMNREIDYGTQVGNNLDAGQSEIFRRYKRIDLTSDFFPRKWDNNLAGESGEDEDNGKTMSFFRRARSASPDYPRRATTGQFERSDDLAEFVTEKRKKVPQVLSSMDIYERAMLRREIKKKSKKLAAAERKPEKAKQGFPIDYEKRRTRLPREAEADDAEAVDDNNDVGCAKHELYIDFDDIGLSNSIIAPNGYSAFQCRGRCDRFRDQQTTNHATVQGIVHRLGLVRDVHMPCCVPTKLLGISVLFFDEHENVVLKMHDDMIADRCGCR